MPEPRITRPERQAPARSLTDDEKQAIRDLHREGHGRNEIARRIKRPFGTVTNFCQAEDLSFDRREELKVAQEIRLADLADLRSYLAHKLMVTAVMTEEELHMPAKIYSFGGRDNTYAEEDVDQPPADAKKQLMATVGIAVEKSLKLAPVMEGVNSDDAKSMLGKLAAGIAALAAEDAPSEAEQGE